MARKINIVLFGIGNAGSALINKVVEEREALLEKRQLDVRFPVITNSSVAFFEKEGDGYAWEANFIQFAIPFRMDDVVEYAIEHGLENLVAVDATPSAELAAQYPDLVRTGFSIVSINESLQYMTDNFEKAIKFLTESRGLDYRFINGVTGGAAEAGEALFKGVIDIAQTIKVKAAY